MACHNAHLFHRIRHSITAVGAPTMTTLATSWFPLRRLAAPRPHLRRPVSLSSSSSSSTTKTTTTSYTWDDVVRISQPEAVLDDPSDLKGFSDKIKSCNRGSENLPDFIPFAVEDHTVGYIHNLFAEHLRKFENMFTFLANAATTNGRRRKSVSLNSSLRTAEDRTRALGEVVKSLGEELIPGFRNELYPVSSSFGGPTLFSLERAAAPYFGIKAYGIHLNGYVEKGGEKYLWVAKRSQTKSTYPGMLDHLVAGGLPHGIACGENVVKECEEEAGIPRSISSRAIPVGAISYMDIDGHRYKRDFLFCYDLKLPESFVPKNEDGEVESFKLIPVSHVTNIIRRTYLYKPNCSVVVIDFLFRHGYIRPESFGYLDLLQSLKSGDFS